MEAKIGSGTRTTFRAGTQGGVGEGSLFLRNLVPEGQEASSEPLHALRPGASADYYLKEWM